MRYFKRRWEESSPELDQWGNSEFFFEVDDSGWPLRQIQTFDSGHTLKYDTTHTDDEFGGLGDFALDLVEFDEYEISASEFEAEWTVKTAHNK